MTHLLVLKLLLLQLIHKTFQVDKPCHLRTVEQVFASSQLSKYSSNKHHFFSTLQLLKKKGAKYELIVECKPEWLSSYIFVNKKYQFNLYLSDKASSTDKNNINKKTRTPKQSYPVSVICIDNNSKPLKDTEHQISPSSTFGLSSDCAYHSFFVSIDTLSMNHGDSQFRLLFSSESNAVNCSEANKKFISVRVINYKLVITGTPQQLRDDELKFYKGVSINCIFLIVCLFYKISSFEQRCQAKD